MSRRRERRFSSAHAIAIAALFFALGGGAYAAVTSLPPNSVGTKQLKNGSVTAAKLARGAGSTRLTTKQKKEIKKLAKAFAQRGPTGPQGPRGDTGAPGSTGPSDTYIGGAAVAPLGTSYSVVASTTVPSGQYLIQAKTTVVGPAENTGTSVVCTLAPDASASPEWDGTALTLPAIPSVTSFGPISLAGAQSFPDEHQVALVCKTQGGSATADNARVWAIKVGSLHGLPVPTD